MIQKILFLIFSIYVTAKHHSKHNSISSVVNQQSLIQTDLINTIRTIDEKIASYNNRLRQVKKVVSSLVSPAKHQRMHDLKRLNTLKSKISEYKSERNSYIAKLIESENKVSTAVGQSIMMKANCKSGDLKYDPARVVLNGGDIPLQASVPATVDVEKFDFIVGTDLSQVRPYGNNGGFSLVMKPNMGVKISTTRYHLYGKFSVKFNSIGPGFVVCMITMSEVQDEIDWETTGPTPHAENNVFYRVKGKAAGSAEAESGVHGGSSVQGGSVPVTSGEHTYEIDWKPDSITWSLDGKVVRTLKKEQSISKLNPSGPKWFPDTPSVLQFGVWQASHAPGWAGVPNWNGKSELLTNFENIKIQCYDEQGKEVPKYPLNPVSLARTSSLHRESHKQAYSTNGCGVLGECHPWLFLVGHLCDNGCWRKI